MTSGGTNFTNFPKLNTGSLPCLLDYVVDQTFNVPGLDIDVQGLAYDVQGLSSEVPSLRPGQTRPNLSPDFTLNSFSRHYVESSIYM